MIRRILEALTAPREEVAYADRHENERRGNERKASIIRMLGAKLELRNATIGDLNRQLETALEESRELHRQRSERDATIADLRKEIERWKKNTYQQRDDRHSVATERDALRAELADLRAQLSAEKQAHENEKGLSERLFGVQQKLIAEKAALEKSIEGAKWRCNADAAKIEQLEREKAALEAALSAKAEATK